MHEEVVGRLLLRDSLREHSCGVLDWRKQREIRPLILTGDRRSATETVAHEGSTVLVCLNSLRLLFLKD